MSRKSSTNRRTNSETIDQQYKSASWKLATLCRTLRRPKPNSIEGSFLLFLFFPCVKNEPRHCLCRLQGLNNVRNARFAAGAKLSQGRCEPAYQIVERNRHKFERPVFGPLFSEVSLWRVPTLCLCCPTQLIFCLWSFSD